MFRLSADRTGSSAQATNHVAISTVDGFTLEARGEAHMNGQHPSRNRKWTHAEMWVRPTGVECASRIHQLLLAVLCRLRAPCAAIIEYTVLGYDAATWNGAHDGLALLDVIDHGDGAEVLVTCGPILAGARCAQVDQVLDELVVPRVNAWLAAQTGDPGHLHCHNHHRLQLKGVPEHQGVSAVAALSETRRPHGGGNCGGD